MIPTSVIERVTEADYVPPEDDAGLVVFSVGRGDTKFSFDPADPEACQEARVAIEDMLRRGYMIFVEVEGEMRRIMGFDPSKNEYILRPDKRSKAWRDGKGEKRPAARRVPARRSRAMAVAPTAGG